MTITYDSADKLLFITNLGNNLGLEGFDDNKKFFEPFGVGEFNPKFAVLALDFEDARTQEVFGFLNVDDVSGINEEDVRNIILYEVLKEPEYMPNTYETFIAQMSEGELGDLDGNGFIYFSVGEYGSRETVYIDIETFKKITKEMQGDLHRVLDVFTFRIYIEREKYTEIIQKWWDKNEVWASGLNTIIPNKAKMREIVDFKGIANEKKEA